MPIRPFTARSHAGSPAVLAGHLDYRFVKGDLPVDDLLVSDAFPRRVWHHSYGPPA